MLAAHAVAFGEQLLALELRALGIAVAQRQCAVLTFTTQVQGDFGRQAGPKTVAVGPRRTQVIDAR
ncbi:hypothetical protein D9M71_805200 [compost metagenome]